MAADEYARGDRVDDAGRERLEFGVVRVDPVPGEVGDQHRRQARGLGGRERQRRHVTDHEPRAELPEVRRLGGDPAIEVAIERGRAPRRFLDVEPQAIELHDAGIRLARLHVDARSADAVEDPGGHARAHVDPDVALLAEDLVDELDIARRVAEAVAGDVEGDRHEQMPGPRRGHRDLQHFFERLGRDERHVPWPEREDGQFAGANRVAHRDAWLLGVRTACFDRAWLGNNSMIFEWRSTNATSFTTRTRRAAIS